MQLDLLYAGLHVCSPVWTPGQFSLIRTWNITACSLPLAVLMKGIAMFAFRGFVPFGWPGAALVLFVVVGAALLYASAHLLVRTHRLPPPSTGS